MVGIFSLGYLGIVLENIFEFNKAAVGMLMASALWVIYAGTAGASGIASSAALVQLAEHVAEVRLHDFVYKCPVMLCGLVGMHGCTRFKHRYE